MKPYFVLPGMLACLATTNAQHLLFTSGESDFKLADTATSPDIKVSQNDLVGVERAAQDVAWDFGRVIGVNGTLTVADDDTIFGSNEAPAIIAGTIGHSNLVDKLVSDGFLDVSDVEGKWESYTSQVVQNPADNLTWALVIAGSDRRGTIYGLYDISEQIGVSPWYWWADVPVKTKTDIWVSPTGKHQDSPSVKYRGFFINDEAPALSSWVNENFGSKLNGDFYRLVFELCLRLKGNYVWPAMWGKMFYVDDPKNGQIAHDYGVIMGTSHHEPMARSETEQNTYLQGDWDWNTNQNNIETFFRQGIERAKDWDTMWTMGMRGKGDAASPTLTAPDLEEVIRVQQSLLMKGLNATDILNIPQTWVLYKEVSGYYSEGMEVPDTVTLLWTDDNSGNLIRVPTASEADRVAGAGVYYHFDYVGSPRSYKWINTIQLPKTWEQLHLAYNKNARQIWIANVGDLKPLEIPLTHFMDMAYDMGKHDTPDATTEWLKRWVARDFGEAVADATADVLNQYGILLGRRKYELLSELPFAFSTVHYDEAERNLAQWEELLEKAQSVYDELDEATQTAYFQLVLHPVLAGKVVVDLYTKTAFNKLYAEQGRISANYAAEQARALFAEDAEIAKRYHNLNGGKWNHFVNQVHIGYTSWNDPPDNKNIMPSLSSKKDSGLPGLMGISIQGSTEPYPENQSLTLLPVDPYMPPQISRYFDVFARKDGSFSYTVSSNASYLTFSSEEGSMSAPGKESDSRIVITVNWDDAPDGVSEVEIGVTGDEGSNTILTLPVNKFSIPDDFSGHVESNGVVSIEASHYTSAEDKNGVSYIEIPHYGRTLSGVKPWPVAVDTQDPETGPALEYSIYTTTSSTTARLIVMLGASHNHDPTRLIKFAYSLDGGEAKTVEPVSVEPPYKEGSAWRKAVVENGWTSTIQLNGEVEVGAHVLLIWLLEPGAVLQKVVLDMGGYQATALGPPESRKI
ncbi:uncharacterized protein DNG_07062 [Cephalotrichum gorgonifer]|uniref:Gylcosyl hydrolase 115 C-terminal domain-containing protein n=1 Tax=Cephalotrichum gorgonifer TaxID=2041049 RepID=A0AAE8N3W9_9PEZI|nr:uncharacterized protein DNG_07062 [Cephalotrichum gorgonifer]